MLRRFLLALLLLISAPALGNEVPRGPEWPFATSDLPADPDWRFGTLANGMRYLIRHNGTPAGQASVQFWVDAGSISEQDDELGYAHFIEHMAFNGSTRVPEGDMVKLLEREGLAFGADTNASTSFGTTLYKLDLPRNSPALLDTALMLMRETASELTFSPAAVEREKGVVLSERRVRDTYALKNTVDQLQFEYPDARFTRRLPIGT
ncbi:MAG: insulinase family protein, partial [Croceibacterium sp.]